jgi:hypothetical protein
VLCLGLTANVTTAKDYFLTMGGGYTPSGNQISLEKNVQYFQRLLVDMGLAGQPHQIFFADGMNPGRDLQYRESEDRVARVNRLLARIAGSEGGLDLNFRSHEIAGVQGVSSRENLQRWLQETGSKLQQGDRVVLYFTGHGGKNKKDAQNPHFYMWDNQRISVQEFVTEMDKLAPEVDLVLVMVQCYSGGFANVVFNHGKPKEGYTPAHRCGFFATVHDRTAAGCTPDINEANYQEYSSFFWAAICGKNRLGEVIEQPDYDADGKISLAEAHAYAVLTSDTIDIPIKTSGALLRSLSKTEGDDLLSVDAPVEELLAHASPVDLAVIQGLSQQLGLEDPNRAKAARELAENLGKQRKEVLQKKSKLNGAFQGIRGQILARLKLQWPELSNPWDPRVAEIAAQESAAIIELIESHPKYSEFVTHHEELNRLSTEALNLERRFVKCSRLLRTLENVVLEANLPKVADDAAQQRYAELCGVESATLDAPTTENSTDMTTETSTTVEPMEETPAATPSADDANSDDDAKPAQSGDTEDSPATAEAETSPAPAVEEDSASTDGEEPPRQCETK